MSSALLSKTFGKFTKFVKENDRLMHLNLSAIELLPDLMLDLIVNIKRSISLHCVHLCGNRLTKVAKYLLLVKLKPHLHQQKIQETLASQTSRGSAKVRLLKEVAKVSRAYLERHEQMYEALKLKEVMTRWMGVQKSYEKDVAKKIQLEFADGKIDRLHLPSLDKKTVALLNLS